MPSRPLRLQRGDVLALATILVLIAAAAWSGVAGAGQVFTLVVLLLALAVMVFGPVWLVRWAVRGRLRRSPHCANQNQSRPSTIGRKDAGDDAPSGRTVTDPRRSS